MKKFHSILTGIVFLTVILVVGGCKSTGNDKPEKGPRPVKIYLKVEEINGEKYFSMYDSNKPGDVVGDTLREGEVTFINHYTDVKPGIKVIWKLDRPSGIKKINKIGPTNRTRKIFDEDARKRFLSKGFKYILSDDKRGPDEEKYIIVFKDKKDKKDWTIDPFLRIP